MDNSSIRSRRYLWIASGIAGALLAGWLAVAVFGVATSTVLTVGLVVAFLIGHMFMHGGHSGHRGHGSHNANDSAEGDSQDR